jgi:hypothetical protein
MAKNRKLFDEVANFLNNIDGLLMDATKLVPQGSRLLVYPIPRVYKGELEPPADMKAKDFMRYFPRHPEMAVVLQRSEIIRENGDIYGQFSATIPGNWERGTIVMMKLGRYKEPIMVNPTDLAYLVDLTDIAMADLRFTLEDIKKLLREESRKLI